MIFSQFCYRVLQVNKINTLFTSRPYFLIKFDLQAFPMNKILLFAVAICVLSCAKNENNPPSAYAEALLKNDSINNVIKKKNDSIRLINQQSRFEDLSGNHLLQYSSAESASFGGSINFNKIGRDLYSVSGNARSGNNTLSIEGQIKRVSKKHLNFDGFIRQNINGASHTRSKKTTFYNEGGRYWRLQDKVNGEGFVDHIDIYF